MVMSTVADGTSTKDVYMYNLRYGKCRPVLLPTIQTPKDLKSRSVEACVLSTLIVYADHIFRYTRVAKNLATRLCFLH
jgi:hypothetical protein